jgi:hypothetical protein
MEVSLSASGRIALLVSVVGLASGLVSASAQENLDRGRTAAQMYTSDCAECHRNPRAVLKTVSPRSLSDFLREHYTASRESAAALATYLLSQVPDPKAATPATRAPARPAAAKPAAAKPGDAKPAEVKSPEAKPAETKPASEPKPETAPAAPASAPAKPSEPEAKPPASEGTN